MHNQSMPIRLVLYIVLTFTLALPAHAQEPPTADADGTSEQVEESDEAFRRRMELEDARRRDPGYMPPAAGAQKPKEKIDELPAESRANIRDQLVDVIMENGEWEPSDALKDYPYEPTAAAGEDAELLQQEQEAWDEQIEKYHQREAEAFGAHRGPPPGPGGQPGAEGEAGADGGESGSGQGQSGGQSGGQDGSAGQAGSAGTYSPYSSSRTESEEEVSTAGAQQSALEFLRGQPGASVPAGTATAAGSTAAPGADDSAEQSATGTAEAQAQAEAAEAAEAAAAAAGESTAESASETPAATERDIPGIIAIEDLDKLEGAAPPEQPEPDEPPDTP